MLAYGLGRLGCQFSGDGDWGIFNTAYIANPDGSMRLSTAADAQYINDMVDKTPFANITAPSWLPDWLFGMTYPHNVGHEGMPIQGCVGEYCNVLPVSVFPTPVYEFFVCVSLFFVMWILRKKLLGALKMFGLYLILAGIERFLVERIRVNYEYDWGFIHPSQAEILSVLMVITGLFLMLVYKDKEPAIVKPG
jgi:phosphatidylglycerol:prolipoprotein diacylglycerol transferase